ncbi:RES domain-containing protein [Mesorhizobium sp. B2-6-2]|uniref:RES domain-containing protein n=1 Tax=Mesorhizobium sp. B2-6-2 TaxID=2589915 RepID=UPI0011260EDF|nr:RES domain-containing protein [Mesorhizobium sp. B2-6-2]TPJ72807.1 hypothetical protein FJ419_27200 [Mesorhizobium sp. B2-6-2]
MNAKGISVLYGALEDETCLAEVRAPVGSQVVIGRFQMLREFRVLDLNRLASIYTSVSEFDPRFDLMVGRARFFERLVQEISRPVMPRDEEDEYLVTQAVAEFLASSVKPQLDGILFDSAQKPNGHNLVLFHRAANVEPYDLPAGTTVQVHLGWSTDDDFDDGISVWETTQRPPLKTAIPKPQPKAQSHLPDFAALIASPSAGDETGFFPYMAPDLRLDVNSMIVHRIASVQYDAPTRTLHRYREQEGEMDEMMGDPATFVYFAYGSNMSSERLRFRVSSCRPLGVATLVGHALRFHKVSIDKSSKCNAYATGNADDVVVGVLYSIRRSQKTDLDTAEGLGKGYDDAMINVISLDSSVVEAVTYFATEDAIDEKLSPYTWYKDFVEEGAAEHHLPQSYVNKYIAPIVAVTDSDVKREKRRRAERASSPKFEF